MQTLAVLTIIFSILVVIALFVFALFQRWGTFSRKLEKGSHPKLKRAPKNPLISPQSFNEWTHGGTFNPAAIKDAQGRVHLIYRAVGSDGVSRLAYASSADGLHFDDHMPYPVFTMINPRQDSQKKYDPVLYPSGGSWGGCEDPRMVHIDDRIYVTFSAFDGWDFIRVGMISIDEDDFFNKRWKWSRPLLLSPAGKVNKNWVLFPERINGKFAVLHSISPEIQIDYVDAFEELAYGSFVINSKFGGGAPRTQWDTWVRGAGPPPIRTSKGWLVLYHAVEKNEPHKYKLGALLLDLKNPKKVIARSPAPILNPDEWYENDWKPGVVYACGATVENDTLYVYYGGGDKHVCIAHIPLGDLIKWLQSEGKVNDQLVKR